MLQYAISTNAGDREINEDSVGAAVNANNLCFVLCDGLGGHGMGDNASALVKNTFLECSESVTDFSDFLGNTFETAQRTLLAEQRRLNAQRKMKTTAVAMITDGTAVHIGHIGDSRLYVFHHNRVRFRTLDHSIPQMLVLSHEIKESQIRNHPERNIVLRVMGEVWEEPKYEVMKPFPMKKAQAFLLCSDGFWELIEETEMCRELKTADTVQKWLDNMNGIVRKNGTGKNMDNFSAIAVWNQ